MAFAGPDEWVLDLARAGQHLERRVHVRTPSVGALAHLAAALVATTEPGDASNGDWVRAVDDEIVDPFSPAAATHRDESVIDPWQR